MNQWPPPRSRELSWRTPGRALTGCWPPVGGLPWLASPLPPVGGLPEHAHTTPDSWAGSRNVSRAAAAAAAATST